MAGDRPKSAKRTSSGSAAATAADMATASAATACWAADSITVGVMISVSDIMCTAALRRTAKLSSINDISVLPARRMYDLEECGGTGGRTRGEQDTMSAVNYTLISGNCAKNHRLLYRNPCINGMYNSQSDQITRLNRALLRTRNPLRHRIPSTCTCSRRPCAAALPDCASLPYRCCCC